LFTTVGVHPTRCDAFAESGDPEAYFAALLRLIETHAYPEGRVVAVGECGLDWDRTQFCAKETQLLWFERQFELAERTNLPMFLHSRACAAEFAETLDRCLPRLTRTASASESADDAVEDVRDALGRHHPGVVVHSFTGGEDELRDLASRPGVFVGVNGCSLRGEETLAALASGACSLERLMLETDAPWCGVKASHPGFGAIKTTWPAKDKKKRAGIDSGETVKDRSEPCHVAQVMEILAETMKASEEDVAEACRANARRVFFGDEEGERERPSR
jgi:TatD DNase family protein